MSIFERIAMLRGERGLSQNALEREVGLPRNTICKWDKSVPSADKLKMVADYFGVTVDYLLTGEEVKKEKPFQTEELSETKAKLFAAIDNMTDEEAAAWLKILKH